MGFVSPLLSTPLLPLLTIPPPIFFPPPLLPSSSSYVWEATGRGRNTKLVWLSSVRKMCLPRFNKFYNCGSHTVGRSHCGSCKPSACPIFFGGDLPWTEAFLIPWRGRNRTENELRIIFFSLFSVKFLSLEGCDVYRILETSRSFCFRTCLGEWLRFFDLKCSFRICNIHSNICILKFLLNVVLC